MQSDYGMKLPCSGALQNGQQCFHKKGLNPKVTEKKMWNFLQYIPKSSAKLRTILVSSTRNTQSWWINGQEKRVLKGN